ncbi:MAG: hypothetical protein QM715_05900 [Nibricoccus sp.]
MPNALSLPRWSTKTLGLAAVLTAIFAGLITRQIAAKTIPNLQVSIASARVRLDGTSSARKHWEDTWSQTSRQPACPARNRNLEAMLEELARTDPQRALALAMAEGNWLLRDKLRNAALRGWGAVAPDAAADWAMAQPELGNRLFCVQAVLSGAVEKPDDAVRVALRVCEADPLPAGDYGHAVINALIDKAGSYEAATKFALAATKVDRQSYLVDSAFYQWAQNQPELAVAKLSEIKDPKVRDSVMKGVVEGWADADAKSLATYAQAMPPGEDRTKFMSIALMQWGNKNPEDTMQWINQFEPHPDFDKGFATLALGETVLKTRPEMAIEMTEYITDPAQRTLTRDNAFWRWALRDPEGARKYAESVQNPEYRASMLDDLTRLPKDQ